MADSVKAGVTVVTIGAMESGETKSSCMGMYVNRVMNEKTPCSCKIKETGSIHGLKSTMREIPYMPCPSFLL